MSTCIVPYQEAYKKDILAIWEKSALATHHFLTTDDFKEIKKMLQVFDFTQLQVYCLTQNNTIVGFAALHEIKIEMLFLHPNYIGKGMGYQLMKYLIEEHDVQYVDVNEQNNAAISFYVKCGFEMYDRSAKDDLGKNYPILKMKLKK